jgi:ABC-type uncharacterized transport system involved in gliding motility auxiliary subunit
MDKDMQRSPRFGNGIAPFGLYLAALASIVSLGLYIVQREVTIYLQISLGLILFGLAFFAIIDPGRVKAMFSGRQVRYGSNAFVMSLAFIGILIVINYFAYQNPVRWDLTADKKNTLTQETLDTLNSLSQPVTVTAFFSPETPSESAKSLLNDYEFQSEGKLSYRFIDPLTDPIAAQEANIAWDGTIVFSSGNNQEQVTSVGEQDFTAALVRLMNPVENVLYFLTGHGEYSLDEFDEQGLSQAKFVLESKNYIVSTLNLLTANNFPEDASVIVIPGNIHPISEEEVSQIITYLQHGGSLIFLAEPLLLTEFGDQPDLLANYLSTTWGIILSKDVIIDQTSSQPFVALADSYGDHMITEKLQRVTSAFPTARSVQAGDSSIGSNTYEIVYTAQQSWAETDFAALEAGEELMVNEEVDLAGPVPLAVIAEDFDQGGRIAVFGDADFITDENFAFLGNGDLFINTVDWAVKQEQLINLTPRENITRLFLPPQPYVMNLVLLVSVFILPGAVLITGIVIWIQKRQRG